MQYPAWLAANKGVVEQKDYDKYERQFLLMTAITDEFDSERPEDSEDVKGRRFERILAVMQQMQELGHPPKEIVGDIVSTPSLSLLIKYYLRSHLSILAKC